MLRFIECLPLQWCESDSIRVLRGRRHPARCRIARPARAADWRGADCSDRAEKFASALKKTIAKIKSDVAKMVAESVEVKAEKEQVLDYKTWSKLKEIRRDT